MKYETEARSPNNESSATPSVNPLEQAALPSTPVFGANSGLRKQVGLRAFVGSLSLSTSVFIGSFGCSAPAPMERVTVAQSEKMALAPNARDTLRALEQVESKLTLIEHYHQSALTRYRAFLVIPSVRAGYKEALEHHRELSSFLADTKIDLLTGKYSDESLADTDRWAEKISKSLDTVIELIESALKTRTIPRDWKAPEGFDYLSRLE